MAHESELTVVAEGVESLEVFNKLHEMGCDYQQGYFISRPMPSEQFVAWFEAQEPPETSKRI